MTRGATQSAAFTEWIASSIAGDMGAARKDASIIFLDYQLSEVKRYNLRNAWCTKVELSATKAGDAAALTEQVTITFEELTLG